MRQKTGGGAFPRNKNLLTFFLSLNHAVLPRTDIFRLDGKPAETPFISINLNILIIKCFLKREVGFYRLKKV
ncbi:MAG: hypothetical protein IJY80_01980 [Opitutales bacterium]|nr:hypothetical protein [Opitutales bacterium]